MKRYLHVWTGVLIAAAGLVPATHSDAAVPAADGSHRFGGPGDGSRPVRVAGPVTRALLTGVDPPAPGATHLASKSSSGAQGDGNTWLSDMSPNGRYLVFTSNATNLSPDDVDRFESVFVRDRVAGTTTLVSVPDDEDEAGQPTLSSGSNGFITPDGRYVAFSSSFPLQAGDTNRADDTYVRDRLLGTTERVSLSSEGRQGSASSTAGGISRNGRYVVFGSDATQLVPGDTNHAADVFVADRTTHVTRRVSVSSDGVGGSRGGYNPTMSADGRLVAFQSDSDDLVHGDTNGATDIFVHDVLAGTTRRISVGPGGTQADGDSQGSMISQDGRSVVFSSSATNLTSKPGPREGVYVARLDDDVVERVSLDSVGNGLPATDFLPAISAGGRYVAFNVRGEGWPDLVLRDRRARTTEIVSVTSDGVRTDDGCFLPRITRHGRRVAFTCNANDMVPHDVNPAQDVLVRARRVG